MNTSRLFLLLFTISSIFCFSQDGTLDASFGDNGIVITEFYGGGGRLYSVGQQSDGKLVVIGNSIQNQEHNFVILRYMSNGDFDTSFIDNSLLITNGNYKSQLVISDDDKINIAGINDVNHNFYINRLLPNGELDTSFGENGSIETEIPDLASFSKIILQPDGKIILLGVNTTAEKVFISRYYPNGTLDESFGDNGIVTYQANVNFNFWHSLQLKDGGKILVLVDIDYQGDEVMFLQYLPNGELDPSFGDNGVLLLSTSVYNIFKKAFTINEDGEIIIVSGGQSKTIITHLLPNGNIDTSYGDNGKTEIQFDLLRPTELYLNSENKLLIYSQTWDLLGEGSTFELIRLNNDGELDATFGENGSLTNEFESNDVIIQNDGKILGVGNTYWFGVSEDFMLVRYHNNGSLSVPEQSLKNITVYPNPSNGVFKIQHEYLAIETPYQISDITGKIIQTGKLSVEQSHIDLTKVQQGIYFLNASGSTYKLVKN